MLDWAKDHWFLTFLLLSGIPRLAFKLVNRVLRTVKVLCRGWPPPHIDADGDWRPAPEEPRELRLHDGTPVPRRGSVDLSARFTPEDVASRIRRSPSVASAASQVGGALLRRFTRRSL